MEREEFAMRREKDIIAAVNAHARLITKEVMKKPPKKIYMKTLVYWNKKKAIIFNAESDDPTAQEPQSFSLEELLTGISLDVKLRQLGKRSKDEARPEGLPNTASPLAVTLSTEAIMVDKMEPNDALSNKILGMPVLVVAGRTANGRSALKIFPVAVTDDKQELRVLGIPAPEAITKRIETMKGKAIDFIFPFFDGYNASGSSGQLTATA